MLDRDTQQKGRHYYTHLLNSIDRRMPGPSGTTNPNRREREDEAIIEQWILGGMTGRLIRHTPNGALHIEPCAPGRDGIWHIFTKEQ